MKWIWIFMCMPFVFFGQKKSASKVDSTAYFIQLANFNKKADNYKSSLAFSQKAYNYAKAKNNIKGQGDALFSLGTTYFDLKKMNDAIETFTKSADAYSQLHPSTDYALCYYNIGLCYMSLEEFTKAEANFDKSQSIYDVLKIDTSQFLNLQKGILYKNNGKIEQAYKLFNVIISKDDSKDIFKTKAEALYQLGTIEQKLNHNNLAVNYLSRALTLSTADKNLDQKAKILLELSVTYEKLLDLKKSHNYLKAHLELKDSIAHLNNKKLDVNDYVDFKESERLKEIDQMTKENEAQQKTNKFAKLISILAIALITILSLLSLSLYKNNIIRTQSNNTLKEKNFELQIAKDNAEKASKARAEFLSTVSHELRTPLNAINGITHLLIEDNPKENQLHYLNSLKFSGNYLLTFINEILEINRIESNNIEIEYIDFNIKQLLLDIKNSMTEIATNNNNRFVLEIHDDVPEMLLGDPTKLSQIFINLINNALKFTQNGEVKVVAKVVETGDDYTRINFAVSDTGIGIPEDKQETIFESFSQGSIEINRKYGGTGLGLTIVKKIVDLLGGEINLKSEVGSGTTFDFELNLFNGKKEVVLEKENLYSDEVLKGKSILVVEDNKINQMVTKKMLEKKEIKCFIIDNGEEAVEMLSRENSFDLVLMDVHLPGINGTIATQKIREFDEKKPIIALTAISLNENREMLLSFGMTDVITKPFEPENFYRVIANNLA
ncbi:tetratricopeptide repeat-containing hybrid sensor histidine kinase/response regulator [Flavobacterium wongokense]|uniref:tetratricopeptide repeat-containing hybrid sensor histidine kinase/response regulator n=1 Tax=Flavobacterium wongokense TaxID=2910674 RepID=UPI001F1C0457|nr:ATP-binding protein [Flavobacterium sp. WG47]MCF6133199.1 ATP-binding protein [Flavobacterium sp. WG47]